MNEFGAEFIHQLDIGNIPKGSIGHHWLHIINNGIGEPVRIPLIVARGKHNGPVLGITAAIHGNELNGIPVIQQLFHEIDVEQLRGTIVGALVLNVPGLLREQRYFNDGVDLNRIAPGKANGSISEVYIHRLMNRIVNKFDYMLDLHTASFGRVNSYYIRADLRFEKTAMLAQLQNAQIIVNNKPGDGTLRGAASALGIRSITLELRDPHVFQKGVIGDSLEGIRNVLYWLNMLDGEIVPPSAPAIVCDRSYWMYTDEGGILRVFPKVADYVKKGELIAEVRTIFGKLSQSYYAPEDGIIIGRSVNPINQTGSRIVHLGIVNGK